MKRLLLISLLPLAGCAVPTTGVAPLSDGLHKITHQGNGGWVRTETLKASAVQEAMTYCRSENKQYRMVDVRQSEARPFGGWPEAEVLFKCE